MAQPSFPENRAKKPLSPRGRGVGERGVRMDQRQFAKTLRQTMTDAEQLLWRHLRAHRLDGQKFRRQQPIGPYIVDFVHFGARLIVEADGGQRNASDRDSVRDAWLGEQGFRVIRFWNHDILQNPEAVLSSILRGAGAVCSPLSPGPSPARGEGRGE
ncbi:Very-short-patch-repair endonuclease [Thiocapsa roseopersicina]|uniref:Very-short-patch-repair endonuclease n=2 Tax=Thiocapsa roseopersicina TaxID=1058 RepID=A0A1H2UX01_THIRO|nr:Very-short-patch-repair endonuclease [Thiocapsa roseopersicina]